jgi:hypothetical protein
VKEKTKDEARKYKKRGFPFALLGVAALIAVIVVNVIAWRGYRDKEAQVEVLKNEIVQVNEQISQAEAPPSGLEARLEAAENDLALARQIYPANIDRNDIFDFMLITANECKVDILPLVWDGMDASGKGQSYYVMKYHTTITGGLSQTSEFMTKLHEDKYPTMTITECSVQRMTAPDAAISRDEVKVSIDLSIALYVASVKSSKDSA